MPIYGVCGDGPISVEELCISFKSVTRPEMLRVAQSGRRSLFAIDFDVSSKHGDLDTPKLRLVDPRASEREHRARILAHGRASFDDLAACKSLEADGAVPVHERAPPVRTIIEPTEKTQRLLAKLVETDHWSCIDYDTRSGGLTFYAVTHRGHTDLGARWRMHWHISDYTLDLRDVFRARGRELGNVCQTVAGKQRCFYPLLIGPHAPVAQVAATKKYELWRMDADAAFANGDLGNGK